MIEVYARKPLDGPGLVQGGVQHGAGGHGVEARRCPYRAGRCTHWIKVKNRKHLAYQRVQDQF